MLFNQKPKIFNLKGVGDSLFKKERTDDSVKLFIDDSGLSLNRRGRECFAWSESIKDEDDIAIEVDNNNVEPAIESLGAGSFQIKAKTKVTILHS